MDYVLGQDAFTVFWLLTPSYIHSVRDEKLWTIYNFNCSAGPILVFNVPSSISGQWNWLGVKNIADMGRLYHNVRDNQISLLVKECHGQWCRKVLKPKTLLISLQQSVPLLLRHGLIKWQIKPYCHLSIWEIRWQVDRHECSGCLAPVPYVPYPQAHPLLQILCSTSLTNLECLAKFFTT